MTDTRFERVTFSNDALPLRQSVEDDNEDAARYVRGQRERARNALAASRVVEQMELFSHADERDAASR